jgi:hypothetical protein
MKKTLIIILLIIPVFLLNAQEKKYGIEKGKVVYKMELMGSVSTITMYFKDYGMQQSSVSELTMFGMTTKNRTIERDGFVYSLNINNKTGIKTPIEENDENNMNPNVNYDELSDDELTEYNAKRDGYEIIAGKKAVKYIMTKDGTESTFCIWKQIPLKLEAVEEGVTVSTTAVEVIENPTFPAGIFEIPDDYNISEM